MMSKNQRRMTDVQKTGRGGAIPSTLLAILSLVDIISRGV